MINGEEILFFMKKRESFNSRWGSFWPASGLRLEWEISGCFPPRVSCMAGIVPDPVFYFVALIGFTGVIR